MSTQESLRDRPALDGVGNGRAFDTTPQRRSTETKASFKTTEFFAYLAVVVGLLIAGNTNEGQEGGADYFAADKVWLYITLLTIGYMVSRGFAKSGSRDPYWGDDGAATAVVNPHFPKRSGRAGIISVLARPRREGIEPSG